MGDSREQKQNKVKGTEMIRKNSFEKIPNIMTYIIKNDRIEKIIMYLRGLK